MGKLISALFFFSPTCSILSFSQPVFSAVGSRRAAALIRTVGGCRRLVSLGPRVKRQPSEGFQKKRPFSHLSTWAWRNRRADKTPHPKLINIKAAISSLFPAIAPFAHLHPTVPASSPWPCTAAFIHWLSTAVAVLPPSSSFSLLIPLLLSVCGPTLNRRSSTGNRAEQRRNANARGARKKKEEGKSGRGGVE